MKPVFPTTYSKSNQLVIVKKPSVFICSKWSKIRGKRTTGILSWDQFQSSIFTDRNICVTFLKKTATFNYAPRIIDHFLFVGGVY